MREYTYEYEFINFDNLIYVEQYALMSSKLCGNLEDHATMCVCCLVVFDLLIHSLF